MTRTTSIISLVLATLAAAAAAAPAAASDASGSPDGIVARQSSQSTSASGTVQPTSSYPDRDQPRTLKAAPQPSPQPSQLSPVRTVEVRASDGFHWGDALIGALIASGLLLVGLAGALTVARHRRTTPESRA